MSRDRWPNIPRGVAISIAHAVEGAGGDMLDCEDLLDTWERLCGDRHGRAGRLDHDAAHRRCCCVDAGQLEGDAERCSRCHGLLPERTAETGGRS